MEKLNLKEIKKKNNGEMVEGVVYVYTHSMKKTKQNKDYFIGTVKNGDEEIVIKCWDEKLSQTLSSLEQGVIIKIRATLNIFNSIYDLNIIKAKPVNEFCREDFIEKIKDYDKKVKKFKDFVHHNIIAVGRKVLNEVFEDFFIRDRFKLEFASQKMHDAQIGGLLNHTLKMLELAKTLIDNLEGIEEYENYTELLYLGIIFHDMGKVYELDNGIYKENSFVTHRSLGVEILSRYKECIISNFNENFFYQLVAICQGHHGEFGDKPTTVMTQIIHLIDMLESQTTCLINMMKQSNDKKVFYNGSYLTF